MDCSLPGSSVHGIFQARVLEWVAVSFCRGSSQPRDWTQVSCIAGRHFTIWATREVPPSSQWIPIKVSHIGQVSVEWYNPTEICAIHTFHLDLFQSLRLGHLAVLPSYQVESIDTSARVCWKTPNYLAVVNTRRPVSQFPNACTNYCHFGCGFWDKTPGYKRNQSPQKLFSFLPFDGK